MTCAEPSNASVSTLAPASERRILAWSTEDVPEVNRLEYWTDAVSSALFEMDMVTPVRHGFHSFVTAAPLDSVLVATLGGSQREAIRGSATIARANQYSFHILVDYSNPWILKWRGSPVRLEPGDIAISDTRFTHSACYPEDSLKPRHNIKLSPQWMGTWTQYPDRMIGKRISGKGGWGKVLSAFVAQLTPEFALAPPLPAKLIADQLGATLSLVESELFPCSAVKPPSAQLASKIIDVIRQRSSEISLTANDVAQSLGISERSLHRHLQATQKSFGSQLQNSRIDAASRMLESVHLRILTTAEIGLRAGFGDPSHFARVMRARLGQPPGVYRKTFVQQGERLAKMI